ncbi:MAG: hypothetical protein M1286_02560 [Candidatus Marsarchaeota archaeon]|nr:hypothetical protein [Candidatus Marsarchaeota archaeon]
MNVIFNTNENIRKLAGVWDMFGPPGSIGQLIARHANYFGDVLYTAAMINDRLGEMASNLAKKHKETGVIWESLLDRNYANTKKNPEVRELALLLDKLDVHLEDEKGRHFRSIMAEMQKDLEANRKDMEEWVRKVFGFRLPQSIDIILNTAPIARNFSNGSSVSYDPFIITLDFYKYRKSVLGVIMHEVLHSLIRKHKLLKEDARRGYRPFEEALLDYFVPDGMLAEKLGLVPKLNIKMLQEKSESNRRWASDESKRLLPAMEEYHKICGKSTIWSFLKKKGFEEVR